MCFAVKLANETVMREMEQSGSRIFRRRGGGGGGLTVMHGAWLWQQEDRVPLKLLPCILHLFIAARFLLACVFRELVILMQAASGLDICLSSCSMMSDSCTVDPR